MPDSQDRILVVDDEKNIRITLSQALEELAEVDTAVNGEDALEKIGRQAYRVVLLDLRMPGMDGMEVLRRIAEQRPEIKFVIITAHGTVDNAVEAMKLGALDYLQKPFTPAEVREVVTRILNREALDEHQHAEFDHLLELARRAITERRFGAAMELLHKAIAIRHDSPEVFNLIGAIHELQGEREEALKNYRNAYWLAPSYAPSRDNFERLSGIPGSSGTIDLGDRQRK